MTTKQLRPAFRTKSPGQARLHPVRSHPARIPRWILWLALGLAPMVVTGIKAADTGSATAGANLTDNSPAPTSSTYNVQSYVVRGPLSLPADTLAGIFARHTGAKVDLRAIVQAAADVQLANHAAGNPEISVGIAPSHASDVVALNVFQAASPQIVLFGQRCTLTNNEVELPAVTVPPPMLAQTPAPTPTTPASSTLVETKPAASPAAAAAAAGGAPVVTHPAAPATPEQIAQIRADLLKKMADLSVTEKDTRIHVVSTNAGPRFAVEHYIVSGNSLLPPAEIGATLTNIDGAFGTNVSYEGIRTAVSELQADYQRRGYVTVAVGLPQQKLTNETVQVKVTEGRLVAIDVKGNEYFSSNNVMRALPSLHTNIILNNLIFQAELNRANANQDRQIYPVIAPGPDPGTSELTLKVKDQLPVHGKEEFNNENSPGTPDFRLNTSVAADNLWQQEHTLGLQYSFSPQQYKEGSQWNFFDRPAVANYSAFYRVPLGTLEPIADEINNNPDSFGYDEATRRFRLPPSSGRPDLTLFASRSTIDTGIEQLSDTTLFNIPFVRQVSQEEQQQGLTVNETAGFQLSKPLPPMQDIYSTIAGGLNLKAYDQQNFSTNIFVFDEFTKGPNGNTIERISHDYLATPGTRQTADYLPLELSYNASRRDVLGPQTFGLTVDANLWYTSFVQTNGTTEYRGNNALQSITGSKESSGHWVTLRPSFSQEMDFVTNWPTTFRADGQWASEPLIDNEQFGIGGVNSVRGYHEGEVFGDTGWHVSLEQQTPAHVVGMIHGNMPLSLRGTLYMDYARVYLLDPEGRSPETSLWGTGFGFTASVGSTWQSRFLFSVPLIGTSITRANQPYFNFILTAQF